MTDELKKLVADTKEYLDIRYNLLKLELLEKLSRIISLMVLFIVTAVLVLCVLVYFSLALIFWLKELTGSFIVSFLIVGGVFAVICAVVVLCKDRFFINPIVRHLSSILFNNDKNETEL